MPNNIILIQHTYDLPAGTFSMWQVDNDADAAYYAAGREAYLYRSQIIESSYLFIPVLEVTP